MCIGCLFGMLFSGGLLFALRFTCLIVVCGTVLLLNSVVLFVLLARVVCVYCGDLFVIWC